MLFEWAKSNENNKETGIIIKNHPDGDYLFRMDLNKAYVNFKNIEKL